MTNNEDNSRRNREQPEDNPFIAFRRFADSQVSSLLNTVFTLPATIANYNNVHQAREACLFKKVDQAHCDKLKEIEDDIVGLRHEGRELYRVGDLQEVLKKSKELMRLDRQADELRKDIVSQNRGRQENEDEREPIQRVANKKGQEWGWDWSWDFPKPFDEDVAKPSHGDNDWWRPSMDGVPGRYRKQQQDLLEELKADARAMVDEHGFNDAMRATVEAMDSSPIFRGMMGEQTWAEFKQSLGYDARNKERDPNTTGYSPRALEADEEMRKTGINWREAFDDLMRAEQNDAEITAYPWRGRRRRVMNGYPKCVPWSDEETTDEPSYEYSHDHEDQHDDPPTPKAKQCQFEPSPEQSLEAKHSRETLEDFQIQKYLLEQQQHNGRYLGLVDLFDTKLCERNGASPSAQAETELDAYEQLLEKPKNTETIRIAGSHPIDEALHEVKPSILSTLTTTERTVAPDGSVTTKVVLKKRFADGREESSETVHRQRGQEMHQSNSPWGMMQNATMPTKDKKEEPNDRGKKSGWFWSS